MSQLIRDAFIKGMTGEMTRCMSVMVGVSAMWKWGWALGNQIKEAESWDDLRDSKSDADKLEWLKYVNEAYLNERENRIRQANWNDDLRKMLKQACQKITRLKKKLRKRRAKWA